MKTSNKILSITLAAIVVFLITLIVVAKIDFGHYKAYQLWRYPLSHSQTYDCIRVGGSCELEILSKKDCGLAIENVPLNMRKYLRIDTINRLLSITMADNLKKHIFPKMKLCLPYLPGIVVQDSATAKFHDFTVHGLVLRSRNKGRIEAYNNKLTGLTIEALGQSSVNIWNEVNTAKIELFNHSHLEISSFHGTLLANARDTSNCVLFSGAFTINSLNISSSATFDKR
jgi:hypothetical protein